MKVTLLKNAKTGETREIPYLGETKKAETIRDGKDLIWLPKSQLKKTEITLTILEVSDWIWRKEGLGGKT